MSEINLKTLKKMATENKKKTRTVKGKIVVLNSKGNIFAWCKETKYGIAWRAPSRKKSLKIPLATKRIIDEEQLLSVIQKVK